MASINPVIKLGYGPGVIRVEQGAPVATLTTLQPVGAHLVLEWDYAQATTAHRNLGLILDQLAKRGELS